MFGAGSEETSQSSPSCVPRRSMKRGASAPTALASRISISLSSTVAIAEPRKSTLAPAALSRSPASRAAASQVVRAPSMRGPEARFSL